MLKWIRYSGASVSITFNPLHWRLIPWTSNFRDEWAGPKEWTGTVSWLFLTINLWIDDGSW